MKKILLIGLLTFASLLTKAQVQADPAHWAYGIKKISGNTYDIHLRCTVDDGWHIYAQEQTKDFIGTQTRIVFNKQTGLKLIGKPKEVGKKDTYVDKQAEITNYELSGTVDFVQKVTIASSVKSITGKVNYQTCTHKQCLPETNVTFNILVN